MSQGLSAISFLSGPVFPKEMLWQFSLKAPRGWARTPSRPRQGGWWHGQQAPGSGQPGPQHCQAAEVTGLSAGGLSASLFFRVAQLHQLHFSGWPRGGTSTPVMSNEQLRQVQASSLGGLTKKRDSQM